MWVVGEGRGAALLLVVVVVQTTLSWSQDHTIKSEEVVELNVFSPAPTKLLATWTSESSETSHFEVMWSPPAEDQVATRSATTTNTSYTIDALTPRTRYTVSVRVVGDTNQTLGFSDNVEAITASPASTVPGRPANVTARATGCRTLWVGWEEPDEPKGVITSYTVIWTHAATSTADTLQVDGNTTATIVLGLHPCTAYSITVSATNGAGSGLQGGPAIATTKSAAPASPTNLNVSQVDGRPDALTVTWTQAAALGYCNITSNTITWWLAAAGHLIGNKTFPATMQVKLTGLQPATTYSMDVSAAVHDTIGPRAGCINGTTGPPLSPGPAPGTPWRVVGMSVAVVVVLAVAGVVIYASRDKLRMLKPRPRMPPTHSGLGLGTPSPRPPVQAPAGQVRTEHLRDYIKHLEQDTQRGLEEEFEQVMQCSAQHPAATAVKDLNKVKNRFRNILPFDHSRVILPLLEGEPCSDYINANHITNTRERQRFVACQGPTNGTVRDFWRLVWQVGTGVVVMLTNLRERGRARCALYWPTLEEPIVAVGDLTVTRCGEAGFAGGLLVREFVLQRGTNQRKIRQYHLTTWPDFGVPSHEHHLLDFISEVRSFVFPESGPLVVHCSAGVGRSGTLIGLWSLMEGVEDGSPDSVNVRQTVLALRECRPSMVQSPEQYMYLYKCIAAYLEEPHRWRTRERGTEPPTVPTPPAREDDSFAYDNPSFTEEATSGGRYY